MALNYLTPAAQRRLQVVQKFFKELVSRDMTRGEMGGLQVRRENFFVTGCSNSVDRLLRRTLVRFELYGAVLNHGGTMAPRNTARAFWFVMFFVIIAS